MTVRSLLQPLPMQLSCFKLFIISLTIFSLAPLSIPFFFFFSPFVEESLKLHDPFYLYDTAICHLDCLDV